MKRWLPAAAVHLALVAGAVATLTPLLWMLSASFMRQGESLATPPPLLPAAPTLDHYRALFANLDLGRNVRNSLIVAGGITFFSVLFNSMAGYAFAKLRFRGRDRIFAILVAGLAIPIQVNMLPVFLLLRAVGLVNSLAGVILPAMAGIFGVFLMRQMARSIPDELLDAARVDGASELRIYWSLVLPWLRPGLATLAVYTFVGAWSDFMWPLIVLTDQDLHTLPVALANLAGEHVQDTELMMAGSVLTVVPVLVVFLALQRYYVAGILAGGLKE